MLPAFIIPSQEEINISTLSLWFKLLKKIKSKQIKNYKKKKILPPR